MTTRLTEALRALGLDAEIEMSGRWAKLRGERCPVYVIEAASSTRYYSWCECPRERSVESYTEPMEAIRAGLRRAGGTEDDGLDARRA
jgi:hypothetical protein